MARPSKEILNFPPKQNDSTQVLLYLPPSVYLPINLPTYLPLYIYLLTYLPTYLLYLPINLSTYLPP